MRNPSRDATIAGQVRSLFEVGASGGLADGELLERFAAREGDPAEAAFAALVERHGPMVLRACRSILRDPHRAQDAFQATFLLLARRAGSLWVRDSLGPWLHSVACRVASGARAADGRRRALERRAALRGSRSIDDPGRDDLGPALHEEIERLPDRLKGPVVLCYLEGLTHDQAAEHLACPVGTVRSRLARGRDRLRRGLVRRGLAPPSPTDPAHPGAAALPPAVAALAIRAARLASDRATVGPLARWLIFLLEGARQMMTTHPLIGAAIFLLGVGSIAGGLRATSGQEPKPGEKVAPTLDAKEREAANRPLSEKNLRTIALALHNYHAARYTFPPATLVRFNGKIPYSWRVAILPYMGQLKLYNQYKFDEPWDGPNNRKLLEQMPVAFRAPGAAADSTDTSYFALTGPGAVFSGKEGSTLDMIPDGMSNTILFVESKKSVPWTKPEDIPFTADDPLPTLGGYYDTCAGKGAFHAAFADGGVKLISGTMSEGALRALISKAGGEVVKQP